MTYHINPETGRPNICRASIRECRYGASKHFDTKQEAQASSEEALSKEFGSVASYKKVSEVSSSHTEPRSLDKIKEELGVLPEDEMRSIIRDRIIHSVSPRELDRFDDEKNRYTSITFHGSYRRLGPMSLDYRDYDTVETFMKGACGFIAFELNRVTGLPIVTFNQNSDSDSGWSGHAVVRLPNGQYFDITGTSSRDQVVSEFEDSTTWTETEVDPSEFKKFLGAKGRKNPHERLDTVERAALAQICFDLIKDYNLNDPERAGEEN